MGDSANPGGETSKKNKTKSTFKQIKIDSFNVWPTLQRGKASPWKEILLNIDQDNLFGSWNAAMIWKKHKEYKLIWGQSGVLQVHEPNKSCNTELYDIKHDISENENIASTHRLIVKEMKDYIMKKFPEMVPAMA